MMNESTLNEWKVSNSQWIYGWMTEPPLNEWKVSISNEYMDEHHWMNERYLSLNE